MPENILKDDEICPTCERPFDEEAITDSTLLDILSDEDEEPTDLEVLEDYIELLEAAQEEGFNLWRAVAIENLKEEASKWYDEDGNKIPVTPEVPVIDIQFSPEEALDLEGWWTVPVGEFGPPIRYLERKQKRGRYTIDFDEGLDLSRSRSNGCFFVRNKQESADVFLSETDRIMDETGTTRRIVQMMGHIMNGWQYMFPTFDFYGAEKAKRIGQGVGHYAIDPEVPFNDEEKRVFKQMFVKNHLGGAAFVGAKWQTWNVLLNPNFKKEGVAPGLVDPTNHHRMITAANHPWWILPYMIDHFNTTAFKKKIWAGTVRLAHSIDRGEKGRVPGYMTIKEMTGSATTNVRALGEDTGHRGAKSVIFHPGSELRRDGSPKERADSRRSIG